MSTFAKYSAYYDLLYRDKDYAGEAAYVADSIRRAKPDAKTILDLGSGTGRHGRLLAEMGFEVHGVERSPEMVAMARAAQPPSAGAFDCEVGDICAVDLGRTFDAVISLFHVINYQVSDRALRDAFQVAARHLGPDGVFLFDVWHGCGRSSTTFAACAARPIRSTTRPRTPSTWSSTWTAPTSPTASAPSSAKST